MSTEKVFKSSDERSISHGPAYVIRGDRPDYLVGRILTIIEAMGLPEKQELSLKNILRQEVYNDLELKVWIPHTIHNLIIDFQNWWNEKGYGVSSDGGPGEMGTFDLTYHPKKFD